MDEITIVIADDQMLMREGLKTILDLEEDFKVIGLAKNGEEACILVESLQPTVVLLDIRMPIMDGIDALKIIEQKSPETFIIILTTFIDTDYIVEVMSNGASGYMLKDMEGDRMIDSIRDAVSGQFILPASVAAQLVSRLYTSVTDEGHNQKISSAKIKLTEREAELALLIIKGLNNREIANVMHVAEGTTRNYISTLYGKLGVVDRAQAIVRLQALID